MRSSEYLTILHDEFVQQCWLDCIVQRFLSYMWWQFRTHGYARGYRVEHPTQHKGRCREEATWCTFHPTLHQRCVCVLRRFHLAEETNRAISVSAEHENEWNLGVPRSSGPRGWRRLHTHAFKVKVHSSWSLSPLHWISDTPLLPLQKRSPPRRLPWQGFDHGCLQQLLHQMETSPFGIHIHVDLKRWNAKVTILTEKGLNRILISALESLKANP